MRRGTDCDNDSPAQGSYAPQLPCVYPDMAGTLSRSELDGALLIGTRVSPTVQKRTTCDEKSVYPCNPWSETFSPKKSCP